MASIKYFPNPQGNKTPAEFKTEVDAFLAGLPAGTKVSSVAMGNDLAILYGDGIEGVAGGVARTPVNDVDYDVLAGDVLIAYTALTAGRAVNLPAAAVAGDGRMLIVVDEAAGATANAISVTPDGTEEIDGVNAAVNIAVNYGFLQLYSDGSNWFTLASRLT
jgi:hypothetical protein